MEGHVSWVHDIYEVSRAGPSPLDRAPAPTSSSNAGGAIRDAIAHGVGPWTSTSALRQFRHAMLKVTLVRVAPAVDECDCVPESRIQR